MKICIPVQAQSWGELKRKVAAASANADMVEIWIDHLPAEDMNRAPEIRRLTKKKLLITVKPRREKGKWRGSERKRIGILASFTEAGVDYVDVGTDTDPKLIRMLQKKMGKKTKLVLSYHNFEKTPGIGVLKKIVRNAERRGADIIKLATMAKVPHDNLTMLRLYALRPDFPLIALCMGKYGKMSRIMAPHLGAAWTYAAIDKKAKSAPGQLTVREYKEIAKILSNE